MTDWNGLGHCKQQTRRHHTRPGRHARAVATARCRAHWPTTPKIKAETKLRVRALARELGYVPNGSAQSMRGQHGPTIGLIIPDIQNDFYASIAKTVADAAAARAASS